MGLVCQIQSVKIRKDNWAVVNAKSKEYGAIKLKGQLASLRSGLWIEVEVKRRTVDKWGETWEVKSFRDVVPDGRSSDVDGAINYLKSRIPGVGKKTAQKLVEIGLDAVVADPSILMSLVQRRFQAEAMLAWEKEKTTMELGGLLQSVNIGFKRQQVLIEHCGGIAETMMRVKDDPWSLALEVPGISFDTFDHLGRKLGLPMDSPKRIRAGLAYCANGLSEETGNTIHHTKDLVKRTARALSIGVTEISDEIIEEAILTSKDLIERINDDYVGVVNLVAAEEEIAYMIAELRSFEGIDIPRSILDQVAAQRGLDEAQRDAMRILSENACSILTGGPGTGKTTTMGAFVAACKRAGKKVALIAPTGLAARRLATVSQHPASTIHRWLSQVEMNDFAHRVDIVIIDESSMMSSALGGRIAKALRSVSSRLIFCGDHFQLPSIEPGCPFKDLILSKSLPTAELRKIWRQDGASIIPFIAKAIREGKNPKDDPEIGLEDFGWRMIECDTPQEVEIETLIEAWRQANTYGYENTTVLAPNYAREAGVRKFSDTLQRNLNANSVQVLEGKEGRWAVGDPVMHLGNDYFTGLTHAMRGKIVNIILSSPPALEVMWEDGLNRFHDAPEGQVGRLVLGYCLTYHRAQGSEYPAVAVALCHHNLKTASKESVYTALTRAKEEVVLVIEKGALELALLKTASDRQTALKFFLARDW